MIDKEKFQLKEQQLTSTIDTRKGCESPSKHSF